LSSTPRQLALGSTHTCARTDVGVECWGDNANHQCGSDNIAMMDRRITSPRVVVGIDSSDEVAAGSFHTCVRSGTLVECFGTNADGQLGDGGSAVPSSFTPVMVSWP
jgi:alpha-tubulin suppressor-like RCC1 family protein